MSTTNYEPDDGVIAMGKAKVYDDKGRTMIPDVIQKELGLEGGDAIRFRVEEEQVLVFVEKAD
jgi:bifunctional DNA-binding transcriptional regulator/antitoxin component of YhaV-PrlF toxin-antitoxin module